MLSNLDHVYFSPAKINLFLRIICKGEDGYHRLSSLFQTVSLTDVLSFSFHEKDLLECDSSSVPCDGTNLVMKALFLFKKVTGYSHCFKIYLKKNIPVQAGLGGGSSDAATTLFALNQLTGQPLTERDLSELGASLGSDVPFFFSLGRAHCSGRGENVCPIPSVPSFPLTIVKPRFGLPTNEVYRALNFCETLPESIITQDKKSSICGDFVYFNDLERAAIAINPRIKEIKEALLDAGFSVVLMSGSGSSFFCIGEGVIPPHLDCTVIPTHTCSRSPGQWYH